MLQAYVEGPYGAPMIDVHSERYKCFLIVSSGLGWTFLRAFKRQLLQDGARGRNIKAVSSVAILRRDDDFQLPEFSGWGCAIADRAKFDAELQVCTALLPVRLEVCTDVNLTPHACLRCPTWPRVGRRCALCGAAGA